MLTSCLSISTTEPEDVETSMTIPFTKPKFLKIMETFGLPPAYLQSIFTGTARTSRYTKSDAAEKEGKSTTFMIQKSGT
jgi:hypothetical protein